MNRHVLIGRLGTDDTVDVPSAADELVTPVQLVGSQRRLDFGIGTALDALVQGQVYPSELGIDVALLAAMVHAADTRLCRRSESQDSWTREIRLVVPVSDPSVWSPATALVERMLEFLTGDRWTIGFRARPVRLRTLAPSRARHMTGGAPFDSLSLLSGGVDSLVGAIDLLASGRTPMFVSHAGEGATSDAQRSIIDGLRTESATSTFRHVRTWMVFPKGLVQGVEAEDTTRGRSFLFIALGVLAGSGFGSPIILGVPENGLIALNVPLDRLRLGSLSTRTTHPFYIACWNDLLATVGLPVRVENPYWAKTKGEMVGGCAHSALLRGLMGAALSCSSPTKARWKGRGIEHCGYCVPCLIRRAALEFAWGHGADPTSYTVADLTARPLNTREAEGQQVRSFQLAIHRIRARPELTSILIHKPGPLPSNNATLAALAGVYRRGLAEVEALLDGVSTTST